MPDFIKQIFWTICYYSFLLMFITGTILVNMLSHVLTPLLPRTTARSFFRRISYRLFDLYLNLMEISGALIINRDILKIIDAADGGLMIIANHPSILDAPILFSRIRGLTCVFKSSLNNSLGIGKTARMIGHLSNDGGLDMIRELSSALQHREKVLLFPEGTRTNSDTVDSFNPGYALAAIRAQVPVQLLRIYSDSPILSKKQSLLRATRFPCTFRLELGPQIEPGEFNTVKSFNKFAESWYRSSTESIDALSVKYLPVTKECSESANTFICSFRVPGDPFYCRGHMPGQPIVPAYAQMAWISELLRELHPDAAGQIEYFRWKFLNPIVPGDDIVIHIHPSTARERVVIFRRDQRVAQGLVSYGRETV